MKQNKRLTKLAREEYENLDNLVTSNMAHISKELSKLRNEEVVLYLRLPDRYRLLKLKVWSEKYRVSLKYILATLVPFWEGFVQRRSRRVKREGLNVRVATLTGKKSEAYLIDKIKEEFPDGINKRLWISDERERILAKVTKKKVTDGLLTSSQLQKTLQDFTTPRQYLRYYSKRVRSLSLSRELAIRELRKRPYRGNPFFEHTI